MLQALLMLACAEAPISSRGLMDKLVLLFLGSFRVVYGVCNWAAAGFADACMC